MRMRTVLLVVVVAGILAGSAPVPAAEEPQQGYLYQWVDDNGTVHIADSPARIPEQYRSRATRTRVGTTPQQEPNQPPIPQAVPSQPRSEPPAENGKALWQGRIREWKKKLADAESRYQNLQQQRNDLFAAWGSPAVAPLANRQQADQIDQQMQQVQQEIEKARNMIDVVIPEEARKAGVPPGWLRE